MKLISALFVLLLILKTSTFGQDQIKIFNSRDTIFYHLSIEEYRDTYLSLFKDSTIKANETKKIDDFFNVKSNDPRYDYLAMPTNPRRQHRLNFTAIYKLLQNHKCQIEYKDELYTISDFKQKKELRGICSQVTRKRSQASYKSCTMTFKAHPSKKLGTFYIKRINEFSHGCPF